MARIIDLLAAGRTFSFEFFPPKDNEEQALLTRTIADLQPLEPSYVSVTYRGGRISRERTTRVVVDLLNTTDLTPMPHLTCVAHPRFELGEIIGGFRAAGLENPSRSVAIRFPRRSRIRSWRTPRSSSSWGAGSASSRSGSPLIQPATRNPRTSSRTASISRSR